MTPFSPVAVRVPRPRDVRGERAQRPWWFAERSWSDRCHDALGVLCAVLVALAVALWLGPLVVALLEWQP